MSSQHIPKERLTAYERWELAAFDEAEQLARKMQEAEAAAAEKANAEPAPAPEPEPAPPPISAQELAALRAQAAEEGRLAGLAEGREKGFAEGRALGEAAAREECGRLRAAAEAFSSALLDREAAIAGDVLQLALDVARQVVRSSLEARPELILPVVREAMAALASPHGHPTLFLNPDDAALVRPQIEDQLAHTGWRIAEDPTLLRGGCRVESGGSEIDASVQERWRRVVESLGRDTPWIGPA